MTMPATAAPYLAATVLLGAAGVAKTMRPAYTANALRAAGLSFRRLPALVRVGEASARQPRDTRAASRSNVGELGVGRARTRRTFPAHDLRAGPEAWPGAEARAGGEA